MAKKKQSSPPSLLTKFISVFITLCIFTSVLLLYLESQLPDVEALKNMQLQVPLRVYTHDGQLIAEFGEMRRKPLALSEIPVPLIQAVLATEDQRFFTHSGVDVPGLLRATFELFLTGTKSQGGSTITMQVARNFYLSREKTFLRKLNEILLAIKIDNSLTKQKILELYLNKIYLGNRAYGVAAASQVYYGKPLQQLTLPELALIAGLPKAPSKLNPVINPIAAKKRRDYVLERMYKVNYINNKIYQQAVATPITARYHGQPLMLKAPYVAEMVRNLMVTSFGADAYTKGYQVYTTVDGKLQQAANQSLRHTLLAYDQRHGYRKATETLGPYSPAKMVVWQEELEAMRTINDLKPAGVIAANSDNLRVLLATGQTITIPSARSGWAGSREMIRIGDIIYLDKVGNNWRLSQIPEVEGALVSLDPKNGAILALTGGFDYRKSNFNHVTQAERQPGSGFKPFIYSAALEKGFTLASVLNDAPMVYANVQNQTWWRPQNDNHEFGGPTRLRVALAKSINLVSIRLLQAVGLPYTMDYLQKFGFNTEKFPHDLSLALGTGNVTPLALVSGYATIANGGYKISPYIIDHIVTLDNQPVYQSHPKWVCSHDCEANTGSDGTKQEYAPIAISPQIAFLMTSALKDVIHYGTGTAAQVLNRDDIAGKTGTTSDFVDTWFSGFNSDIVTTSWVGFDQPAPLHEYGAQAALPMWIEFMKTALAGKPEHSMAEPPDILTARIDPTTGLLARAEQENGIFEYFRTGTLPSEVAPVESPSTTGPSNSEPLY